MSRQQADKITEREAARLLGGCRAALVPPADNAPMMPLRLLLALGPPA